MISITQLGRRSNNKSCKIAYHAHRYLIHSGPIDMYPVLFIDFFHTYLVKMVTWTHFFKNATHSGDSLKRWLLLYVYTDENGDFWTRWCHTSYIPLAIRFLQCVWAMLPYFHRFSVCMEGQVKTIGIRYLWTRIFLKNIRICVDIRGLILTYLQSIVPKCF